MSSLSSTPATVSDDAGELARSYERLRMDALDNRRISSVGAGLFVLRRQGLAAWVQLQRAKPCSRRVRPRPVAPPPTPARPELLDALTDLVFHAWTTRSSS